MALNSSEAAMRALDARCSDRLSTFSKNTVTQLSALPVYLKDDYFYNTALWDLASLARCCLAAGLSPDLASSDDLPVLVVTAQSGSARVMKVLLDAGANHALSRARDGCTALSQAACNGHLACIRVLLAAGADPDLCDSFAFTPLMAACSAHHADCFAALLPVTNLGLVNREGSTIFHLCVACAATECFELLLPLVSDVNVRTVPGVREGFDFTALHLACHVGTQSMAKQLLKRGASRTARDSTHCTPLMQASIHGHLSCAVLLLRRPTKMSLEDVNAKAQHGLTALHLAAGAGFDKICGVLLEAGAQLDAKAQDGSTPLMLAQHLHPTNAPLLAMLSGNGPAQLPGTVCDHCGKTPEQASVNILKACGNCHAVRFCGTDCAAAAWPVHKMACRARKAELEEATRTRVIF